MSNEHDDDGVENDLEDNRKRGEEIAAAYWRSIGAEPSMGGIESVMSGIVSRHFERQFQPSFPERSARPPIDLENLELDSSSRETAEHTKRMADVTEELVAVTNLLVQLTKTNNDHAETVEKRNFWFTIGSLVLAGASAAAAITSVVLFINGT